jgi:hypothetical protein
MKVMTRGRWSCCPSSWSRSASKSCSFPVTYKIAGFLKRVVNEDHYDRDTDFNPFTLNI